jgi:hypothetical protein
LYLITSLDDYSRYLLYAEITEKETSWAHVCALESLCTRYGLPFSYYVDNDSIFRFIEKRDSVWRKHYVKTDEADPQWKQVLQDLRVKVIYALSAPAKGKIERPYRWLQDHIVRTSARENVQSVAQIREILRYEVKRYNEVQVHRAPPGRSLLCALKERFVPAKRKFFNGGDRFGGSPEPSKGSGGWRRPRGKEGAPPQSC